ncbi:MAG: triose-phosphate isomerase [Oscillospiraceae bacterium]|nr:triose-phosphate isomerase [Oscillospiraceae bacterium]
MLSKIKPPFFELGPKSYMYGRDVVDIALLADEEAVKNDIRVIFTAPLILLERIASRTKNLYVFAPCMDDIRIGPGGGGGKVLPESVRDAGAHGVCLNHPERPVSLSALCGLIQKARDLGLYSEVCASSMAEVRAVANLSPNIIISEPAELIGTAESADLSYIRTSLETVGSVNADISVLIGAGISSGNDVYKCIYAGADAAGSASGIFNAKDPKAKLREMFAAVRRAWDDRQNGV